jgi:hypothetical protein
MASFKNRIVVPKKRTAFSAHINHIKAASGNQGFSCSVYESRNHRGFKCKISSLRKLEIRLIMQFKSGFVQMPVLFLMGMKMLMHKLPMNMHMFMNQI